MIGGFLRPAEVAARLNRSRDTGLLSLLYFIRKTTEVKKLTQFFLSFLYIPFFQNSRGTIELVKCCTGPQQSLSKDTNV